MRHRGKRCDTYVIGSKTLRGHSCYADIPKNLNQIVFFHAIIQSAQPFPD